MGGVCASKVDYAFQLDDSGLGFTADEMDLWDWEKLTDYVKGKPIRQYELDCAFKRFRLLCAEALTRKAGGGHHHHHHQKGVGAGNHSKKQGKLAKMSFKDLDPHFSKQVIDTFGASRCTLLSQLLCYFSFVAVGVIALLQLLPQRINISSTVFLFVCCGETHALVKGNT